jgi:hypothetical protein
MTKRDLGHSYPQRKRFGSFYGLSAIPVMLICFRKIVKNQVKSID